MTSFSILNSREEVLLYKSTGLQAAGLSWRGKLIFIALGHISFCISIVVAIAATFSMPVLALDSEKKNERSIAGRTG
jgi:hypothetical protein